MSKKQTTKERLIEAASEIFARKGFRETTVAEICEVSKANIAAVNYHFGDKTKLYLAVWNYLYEASQNQFPVPKTHKGLDPETWLRQFLHSRLQQITAEGTGSLFPKLIHHEMTEITAEHEQILLTYLRPNHLHVRNAIRDFMGESISEEQLSVATLNFMGVHISMNLGYQKQVQHPALQKEFPLIIHSEDVLQQIEHFAFGGLNEVKKGLSQ